MNNKEKLAGAVLVLTLAVGIFVDIWVVGPDAGRAGFSGSPVGVTDGAGDGGADSVEAAPGPVMAEAAEPGEARAEEFRRLDINRAGAEELMLLPGIGPKKAEAMIAYREAHGPFSRIESLMDVKGIGPATLERLRPYISAGE
jgi:competence protein ComEA